MKSIDNHLFTLQYIDYLHQCYREDAYYLSLSNIDKLAENRRVLLDENELLASGELERHIIVNRHLSTLYKLVDIYRKERMLIYGCLMIKGRLNDQLGFVKTLNIHSPIFYFPANINNDEPFSVSIESQDLRLNSVLLRHILKPGIDAEVIHDFPAIEWPISKLEISKIEDWLVRNTVISNTEELVRWPTFNHDDAHNRGKKLFVSTGSCLVLADRSKGSRGILHELNSLLKEKVLSAPLLNVFSHAPTPYGISHSIPELLPSILSSAQKSALHNASKYALSLVSGPPGTGKSYTIAAIAIDRMLQGEKVLIVTKSEQATNIIGHLLKQQFGLNTGVVCANDQNFIKSLKAHLNDLLTQGLGELENALFHESELRRTYNRQQSLQTKYENLLWSYKHCHVSNHWFKKLIARTRLKLSSTFTLWKIKEELENNQKYIETQSAAYINAYRNSVLNDILLNHRNELVKFQSALKSKNSKTADERFAITNFDIVLKAFPIWLIDIDDVNRVLPFSPELFDLVIVDEATQCDIASAVPALQRAKRACVVGDAKQLRHISFLSKAKSDHIKLKSFGDLAAEIDISYREDSFLDIVSNALPSQSAVSMLNEHFRSKPELISFSNTHFYGSKLVVMQARPNTTNANALHFISVDGKRTSAGKNKIEKDAVIKEIERIISKYETSRNKPSIGVISPYREQTLYLKNAIDKQFPPQIRLNFRIKTATPYGFQGEERDIVLISFGIDNDSLRAAAYLNRADMFNVLVTRAKQVQKVFYSIHTKNLNNDNLLYKYLTFDHKQQFQLPPSEEVCQFAEQLKNFLESQNVSIWVDDTILGLRVDIICSYKNTTVAIDLVGYPGKLEDYACYSTYGVFNRAGIIILPIPYVTWKENPDMCKAKLKALLLIEKPSS